MDYMSWNFLVRKKNKEQFLNTQGKNEKNDSLLKSEKVLGDLANETSTYWRFSQSAPGRSIEECYIGYVEGEITRAEELDHSSRLLSFVDDKHIGYVFQYGDTLTKILIDNNNDEFKKIAHMPVYRFDSFWNHYTCEALIAEHNYSLKHKNTIKLLTEMSDYGVMIAWFANNDFVYWLKRIECYESADLVSKLSSLFYDGVKEKKQYLDYIEKYRDF